MERRAVVGHARSVDLDTVLIRYRRKSNQKYGSYCKIWKSSSSGCCHGSNWLDWSYDLIRGDEAADFQSFALPAELSVQESS